MLVCSFIGILRVKRVAVVPISSKLSSYWKAVPEERQVVGTTYFLKKLQKLRRSAISIAPSELRRLLCVHLQIQRKVVNTLRNSSFKEVKRHSISIAKNSNKAIILTFVVF